MPSRLLALIAALLLAACVTPAPIGNYLPETTPPATQQGIAADAVDLIANTYPPAKTTIAIAQTTEDVFGVALLEGLRRRGFAVNESAAAPAPGGGQQASDARETAPEKIVPATGEKLGYALDEAGSDLLRLSLYIGGQVFTRAYVVQSGRISTAGSWSRRTENDE